MFVSAVALMAARMPDRLARGFLWAEDVKVYLGQGYELGGAAVFEPYAGYLHVVPRLIILALSTIAPPSAAVRVLPWTCAAVTGACCAYLLVATRPHLGRLAAVALAFTLVLVPQDGEVWLTITNLQWVLGPVLLVLLWQEVVERQPARAAGHIARVAAILLLTLNGPFGVLFLPAVAVMALATRRRAGRFPWLALSAYALAVAVQIGWILTTPDLGQRGSLAAFAGAGWTHDFLRYGVLELGLRPAWSAALGALAPIVALGGLLAYGGCLAGLPAAWRLTAGVLALTACMFWTVGRLRFGPADVPMQAIGGSRYLYVPFVLVTWSLILAAAKAERWARGVSWFLLLSIGTHTSGHFRLGAWRETTVERSVGSDGVRYTISPPPDDAFAATIRVPD